MKRYLAIYGFACGFLGSLGAAAMYVAALRGELRIPDKPALITTILAVNASTWVLALYRPIGETPWQPVFRVTRIVAGLAKALLSGVLTLVVGTIIYLRWQTAYRNPPGEQAFLAFVMSVALLQAVFLAIYWAVRPENIFPSRWIRRWNSSNPLLVRAIKAIRVRKTRANRRAGNPEQVKPEKPGQRPLPRS